MTPEAGAANGPFVSAVEAIYACAATPSKWPQALQAIADVFGDAGTVLLWRRDDGSIGTIVSPKLAAAEADFHKGWWRHDFRTFRALEHGYLRSQEVLTDRHVATHEEIARTRFTRNFCCRMASAGLLGLQFLPIRSLKSGSAFSAPRREPRFRKLSLKPLGGFAAMPSRHFASASVYSTPKYPNSA